MSYWIDRAIHLRGYFKLSLYTVPMGGGLYNFLCKTTQQGTHTKHLWTVPHTLFRKPEKHRKPRIPLRKTRKTTENPEYLNWSYGKHGKHRKLRKTQNTEIDNTENGLWNSGNFRVFPIVFWVSRVFRVFCVFRVFWVFRVFRCWFCHLWLPQERIRLDEAQCFPLSRFIPARKTGSASS